jgi:hypothetical protein
MSVGVRLAVFAAGLAVVFAATFRAGAALRPADDRPTPTTTHAPDHEAPATTHAAGDDPSAHDADGERGP